MAMSKYRDHDKGSLPPQRLLLWLIPLALLGLGLEAIMAPAPWIQRGGASVYISLLAVFVGIRLVEFYRTASKLGFLREHLTDVLLLLPLVWAMDGIRLSVGLIAVREAIAAIRFVAPLSTSGRTMRVLQFTPARVVASSFAGTILVGTILLTLPVATQDKQGTTVVDALFTATSAVCVTGLTVLDTPVHFSTFGQVVIMILMQVGGLGIMTFSTFLALALRQRIGMQDRVVMQDLLEESNIDTLKFMIVGILKMTFVVESIGALVLTWAWLTEAESVRHAVYLGVFHSIAAFNNAGFALFSDSLMQYRSDLLINLTITSLIIIGGLGFTVIAGVVDARLWKRRKVPRLSCHAKLVLVTTGILIGGGTLVFFLAEWSKTMADFSWSERLLAAYFLAITPRTAGFNTVDTAALTDLSLFITIILMFVGASPASTGGGVKTSTFALLVLNIRSILRKRDEVEVFYRTIPREAVHKALVIITFSFSLINLYTILLLLTDGAPLLPTMFEVVSAFGTVGLSMGFTPHLTTAGRVVILTLMFIGRIGPLTMALALGERQDRARFAYPTERVMVG
jgi:trk system potassium uptake protein TrkH